MITLDVGGTSADIGLAQEGRLRMKHLLDTKVGPYQAMIPMVDVDTIGAGGGSIAYVDARRHLPRRPALGGRRSRARPPTAAAAPSRPRPTRWSTSAGCSPEAFLGGGDDSSAPTSRARRSRTARRRRSG